MKAIILSAGQGKRLLPVTERLPKCAVSIDDRALIDWQIDALVANGIDQIVVVTGFGAAQLEPLLAARGQRVRIRTVSNPLFAVADNLFSCWMARSEMDQDFVLLNGDTVFEPEVLRRLLDAPPRPVVMGIDRKAHYDDDDMKVQLQGERLLHVGKGLPIDAVDGESIGMMVFRGDGPTAFRSALERAVGRPKAEQRWYLSILDEMAADETVWTQSVQGLEWAEIDYPLDLVRATTMVSAWNREDSTRRALGSPATGTIDGRSTSLDKSQVRPGRSVTGNL
jgi:choline kinase